MSNVMDKWAEDLPIIRDEQVDRPVWQHEPLGCLIVPPEDEIRKRVVQVWHDHRGGGHLGRDETT